MGDFSAIALDTGQNEFETESTERPGILRANSLYADQLQRQRSEENQSTTQQNSRNLYVQYAEAPMSNTEGLGGGRVSTMAANEGSNRDNVNVTADLSTDSRPLHTLPYTDFMGVGQGEEPVFHTGNHLLFPRTVIAVPGSSRASNTTENTRVKSQFSNDRTRSSRRNSHHHYYYHDNYNNRSSYRGKRIGPHHKYATVRHSPILSYNNHLPRLYVANGDIRKSQSLGRSASHSNNNRQFAYFVPEANIPVIYQPTPNLTNSQAEGGIDNMALTPRTDPNELREISIRRQRVPDGEMIELPPEAESVRAPNSARGGSGEGGTRDKSIEGSRGAVINFLRYGYRTDGKESCVSFFDIETDKVSSYMYRPGEQVSGAITIMVRHSLQIRFVELVVIGRGHVIYRPPGSRPGDVSGGLTRSTKETYFYKRTYVIGSGDQAWSSLLTPGKYTSKFRVKLPKNLPSTIHHHDATNGLYIHVSYFLKARICDDPTPSSSVRSRVSTRSQQGNQMVRVLMSKQIPFNVQRSFDLSTIPDAASPVIHTEKLFLSCAHNEAAVVTVNLDRSVFLAGDDVRLQLSTSLPHGQKIKDISCSMQEHVTLDLKREPVTIVLSRMVKRDSASEGGRRSANQIESERDNFEVTIPTQTDLVSPFSLGCSRAKIEYSLAIAIRFARAGGKLAFKVPLTIGPCAEPIYAEKTSSRKTVPVFNRPTRFPHFTSPVTTQPSSQSAPSAQSQDGGNSSVRVQSKYTNGCCARFFLCCATTTKTS